MKTRVLAAAVTLSLAGIAAARPAPAKPVADAAVVAVNDPVACVLQTLDAPASHMRPAFRDCTEMPVMVSLPSGAYQMGDAIGSGSGYESPVHQVKVRGFALGRYEVTRGEWAACERAGACITPRDIAADARLPVTGVTWEQAQQYVGWASRRSGKRYRLPSESEWEYAARAGLITQYTWGNSIDSACQQANVFDHSGHDANPQWNWQAQCDDGYAKTAPVGRFPPNAWGLHDMLGNVWEWVGDCWHSDYSGAPDDGSAWVEPGCRKRVNRGGGWGNPPTSLRITNRDGDPANARSDGIGFRVARELAP